MSHIDNVLVELGLGNFTKRQLRDELSKTKKEYEALKQTILKTVNITKEKLNEAPKHPFALHEAFAILTQMASRLEKE